MNSKNQHRNFLRSKQFTFTVSMYHTSCKEHVEINSVTSSDVKILHLKFQCSENIMQ